jgi:hypothetical protein
LLSRTGIGTGQKIFNQIRTELWKMIDQLLIRQPLRAGDFVARANRENNLLANKRLPGDKMFDQGPVPFARQRHAVTTLIFHSFFPVIVRQETAGHNSGASANAAARHQSTLAIFGFKSGLCRTRRSPPTGKAINGILTNN